MELLDAATPAAVVWMIDPTELDPLSNSQSKKLNNPSSKQHQYSTKSVSNWSSHHISFRHSYRPADDKSGNPIFIVDS